MEFITAILAQFHAITGLVQLFFGGLADLASAPVAAASGLDAVVSAGELVAGSVKDLADKYLG